MKKFLLGLFGLLVLSSCEEEFIPEVVDDPEIVVEGYIEAGEEPTPPYVLLTNSLPFFSTLNAEEREARFVRGAVVEVSDGDQTVTLTEICLQELSPAQQELAAEFLGVNPDSTNLNVCLYVDLTFQMTGREGKTYTLHIQTQDGQELTAQTTIPPHVPLDSLYFRPPPGQPNDTLAQLRCLIEDPADRADFYRYETAVNDAPFVAPLGSVTDDKFFNGQSFEFPLSKAEPRGEEFDPTTFGLFRRGTTATIKWMTIGEEQFNFWNTLEFSLTNQGPFSSYTRVSSNIEGGLGVWGGISVSYYEVDVPER